VILMPSRDGPGDDRFCGIADNAGFPERLNALLS